MLGMGYATEALDLPGISKRYDIYYLVQDQTGFNLSVDGILMHICADKHICNMSTCICPITGFASDSYILFTIYTLMYDNSV